jgi:uncharacterized protein
VPAKLIILFAKAPVPGLVKTRLFPVLTPKRAAELHQAFVVDMIQKFRHVEGATFELHTNTCSDAWASLGVTRKLQISGDLGLKMIHSLKQGLRSGAERVLIVGSDVPTVPMEHVLRLLDSSADVSLGPASDGGFYAISARRVTASMFDTVKWSESDTLARTIEAIKRAGLSVEIGAEWFDVDEPADLERLMVANDLPPYTRACLEEIRAQSDNG